MIGEAVTEICISNIIYPIPDVSGFHFCLYFEYICIVTTNDVILDVFFLFQFGQYNISKRMYTIRFSLGNKK